jgi:hypothetical protein
LEDLHVDENQNRCGAIGPDVFGPSSNYSKPWPSISRWSYRVDVLAVDHSYELYTGMDGHATAMELAAKYDLAEIRRSLTNHWATPYAFGYMANRSERTGDHC